MNKPNTFSPVFCADYKKTTFIINSSTLPF